MSCFDHADEKRLRRKIIDLNNAFSETKFKDVLREIREWKNQALLTDIIKWLNLLLQEDLLICNGILAWLYFSIECYDQAAEYAVEAEKHFPDTPIWDNLAKNALLDGTIEQGLDDFE